MKSWYEINNPEVPPLYNPRRRMGFARRYRKESGLAKSETPDAAAVRDRMPTMKSHPAEDEGKAAAAPCRRKRSAENTDAFPIVGIGARPAGSSLELF